MSSRVRVVVGVLSALAGGCRAPMPPIRGDGILGRELAFRSARLEGGERPLVRWVEATVDPGSPLRILGARTTWFDDRDGDGELDPGERSDARWYRATPPGPVRSLRAPARELPPGWLYPAVLVEVETTAGRSTRAWRVPR